MRIKRVEVDYIESGAFQGNEGDVSKAGIDFGEACVVMSRKEFDRLKTALAGLVATKKAARDFNKP